MMLTASNLPEPARMIFPIEVSYKAASIKDVAEQMLARFLPNIFKFGHLDGQK